LAAIDKDYQHKQSLIEKAKAEYTKKNLPASAKTEGGDSMLDPSSPISAHRKIHSSAEFLLRISDTMLPKIL